PFWEGTLPAGMTAVQAPTNTVLLVVRTQVNGPADFQAADSVRRTVTVTPLSYYGQPYTPPPGTVDPTVPKLPPQKVVGAMDTVTFFNTLAELMFDNPPALPGDGWAVGKVAAVVSMLQDPDKVALLADVPQLAAARIAQDWGTALGTPVDGWSIPL